MTVFVSNRLGNDYHPRTSITSQARAASLADIRVSKLDYV
jgi:hypothetical protein